MYERIPKRPLNRMTKRMIAKVEEPRYLELIIILILQDHQKIINPHNHLAPNPKDSVIIAGEGPHGKRMCYTFKLLKGRSFNVLPPKSKKSKGARSSTNPTQTDSITLKAIRKQYHNPDPFT